MDGPVMKLLVQQSVGMD